MLLAKDEAIDQFVSALKVSVVIHLSVVILLQMIAAPVMMNAEGMRFANTLVQQELEIVLLSVKVYNVGLMQCVKEGVTLQCVNVVRVSLEMLMIFRGDANHHLWICVETVHLVQIIRCVEWVIKAIGNVLMCVKLLSVA